MKKSLIITLIALSGASALSQPVAGKKFEVGFSGGYQSFSSDNSSSSGVLLLTPRVGYFAFEGIEIEGEGTFAIGGVSTSYLFNANVSYNFPIQARAFPFLLVGYGVADSVPVFNIPSFTYDQSTLHVLNLGVGFKVLVADNVSMRIEYRYQKFTGTQQPTTVDSFYQIAGQAVDVRLASVFAGFSVFF